jgi:hypothetical protein
MVEILAELAGGGGRAKSKINEGTVDILAELAGAGGGWGGGEQSKFERRAQKQGFLLILLLRPESCRTDLWQIFNKTMQPHAAGWFTWIFVTCGSARFCRRFVQFPDSNSNF